MAKFRTHYDNLKVARNAPDAVIRAAYKALMQQYHPDKYKGSEAEALRIAKIIQRSYEVLADPAKRAEHDAWIAEQERQEEAFKTQREDQPQESARKAPSSSVIDGRYLDHGDGTVTDTETGLQWMRHPLGQSWNGSGCVGVAKGYTWQGALDAARELNRCGGYADHADWRVPTIDDLRTLISRGRTPAVNQAVFPGSAGIYWSSSRFGIVGDAWYVNFKFGDEDTYGVNVSNNVILVRGKETPSPSSDYRDSQHKREREEDAFSHNADNRDSSRTTSNNYGNAKKANKQAENHHPWRRMAARYIDMCIFGIAGGLCFMGWSMNAENPLDGQIRDAIATLLGCMALEPVALSWFGNTPGKALLNMRLSATAGESIKSLPFNALLSRTFEVYFYGLGLGFRLIVAPLFFTFDDYKRMKATGVTRWDEASGTRASFGSLNFLRFLAGTVLAFTFFTLGLFSNAMNRVDRQKWIKSTYSTISKNVARASAPDIAPSPQKPVAQSDESYVATPKPAKNGGLDYAAALRDFTFASIEDSMVRLPGGTFRMGSPSGESGRRSDENFHIVTVDAFSIGKYEVTQEQWKAVMGSNPSYFSDCGDDCPVEQVSWNDVQQYIARLNQVTGKRYRLPTEAEWEYAARAATATARYWGDDADAACGYANAADWALMNEQPNRPYTTHNCNDGYAYVAPVGSFGPNDFGLHDMLGNVWEWTCSAYAEHYDRSENLCAINVGARRAIRGGSWYFIPALVRSASRYRLEPTYRSNNVGFRLAHD